jgi:hypothetical protein
MIVQETLYWFWWLVVICLVGFWKTPLSKSCVVGVCPSCEIFSSHCFKVGGFSCARFFGDQKGPCDKFFWTADAAGWLLEFPEFLCLIFDPSDSIDLSSDLAVLDIFFGAHTSHLPSFNTLNNNGFHEESEEEGTGTHY